LALGTPATVTPVVASYGTVFDTTLNATRPIIFATDQIVPGKQATS
jgi:hypothetical protein